jgi:hypothetical protein
MTKSANQQYFGVRCLVSALVLQATCCNTKAAALAPHFKKPEAAIGNRQSA